MPLNLSSTAEEARRILALAWPVMLTSLNWTLMHMIDVAIVGHVGADQLGALAAGRALTFITIVVGIASMSGIMVFASRYDGAGQRERCGDVLRQGLICSLAMGIPTALAMFVWSVEITRGIGIAPTFVEEGAQVVQIMAISFPAQMILAATAYFLEGVSRPGRAMTVNLLMLPLNALLAWAWTGGHLGFPAAGAIGAVSATAVVSALGAICMLIAAWTLPDAKLMRVRDLSLATWREAVKEAPRLVKFGFVPGLGSGLEMAGFSVLIALSTQLGAVATGAFQAVFSLHNFAFAVGIGMASAAGVRAGNAVGEGAPDAAVKRTLIAAGLMLIGMGLVALLYVVFGVWLAALFSNQPDVRDLSTKMLRILAPFTLFDGLQLVFVYALRSLGDQVAAGINGIIAFFLVTGGMGWWLIVTLGHGPLALVIAAASGMVVATILQGGRLLWVSRQSRLQSSG